MAAAFQNPAIPLSQSVTAALMVIGAAVVVIAVALFAARGKIAAPVMRIGVCAVRHIAWPALAY